MIVGLDHIVIGVRDLNEWGKRFREALGFVVTPGGRHPGGGTQNLLIHFEPGYLELLVVDGDGDRNGSPASRRSIALSRLLAEREGLLGYALRSDDISGEVRRLQKAGFPFSEPLVGTRVRPDGSVVEWRYSVMGEVPWCSPYPFLIQWSTPFGPGRDLEVSTEHPIGALRVASVTVAVHKLDTAVAFYETLGLQVRTGDNAPASLRIDGAEINLAQESLEQGLIRFDVAVSDLRTSIAMLRSRGVAVMAADADRQALVTGSELESLGLCLTDA